MTSVVLILALLIPLVSAGMYLLWQSKKAGRNESDLKHSKNANEELNNENEDLADRPRNLSDRTNELQEWRDQLSKNKD